MKLSSRQIKYAATSRNNRVRGRSDIIAGKVTTAEVLRADITDSSKSTAWT